MSKPHSFALALALCASSLFADRVVTDQLGRDVTLPDQVKRIVSASAPKPKRSQ